jgi:hypothetical protein
MCKLQKALVGLALAVVGNVTMFGPLAWAGSLKDSPQAETQRGVFFTGFDAVEGARYAFAGVVVALNNDISRDGWAVRAYGSWVGYDLNPGDGRGWQGDLMLGYRFVREHYYGGIYAGIDYQNYQLDPDDPTAEVRGTEVGLKIAAELATTRQGPYYFALHGNYTTAFDTYWARARAGLTHRGVTFGPEGSVVGNVEFDAQRLGGFITFDIKLLPTRSVEVTLSAGHQFLSGSATEANGGSSSSGGGEGAYATIAFSVLF